MLAAALSFILAQDFDLAARRRFVDEIDKALQERFIDLSETEKGRFGISRIEANMIDAHFKRTNPPVRKDGLSGGIAIYGSKGKPLDPKTMQVRFSRWSGSSAGIPPEQMRKLMVDLKEISATIPGFKRDKKLDRKEFARKPYYAQIRPIRLSQSECLSCHKGMSLGDPVALAVYTALPLAEQPKPPRGKISQDAVARTRSLADRR